MILRYCDKEIQLADTKNALCMKYRAYKIYFAILIWNCNRFSTIRVRQTLDVIMVDYDFVILGYEIAMHENTVFSVDNAVHTIIVPTGTFSDLKIGNKFEIIEKEKVNSR